MPRYPLFEYRDLSATHGDRIRPVLLRALTDLYVQKPSHTPEEERHFTELALRLIDHVDATERARLGARLAAYPRAPLAVIQRLAQPNTVEPVAPLSSAPVTHHLPRIEEPPRQETLSETFFTAAPAERRLILLHLDYSPIAPALISFVPDATARLERAAVTRRPEAFAAAVEQILALPRDCAQRIVDDHSGEALVAALKALALPSPAAQHILLFANPAISRSVDTYFALVRLYDEIGEDSARRMVAIWRMDSATPRHQPQLADDRPTRARDFARHEARPSPGKQMPDIQPNQQQTDS